MEYFEIYHPNGESLGICRPRSLVHQQGDWHRSFNCWIVAQDTHGEGWLLFQLRSPSKDVAPNVLVCTAGGHYAPGEGIEGGLRELREELGIEVDETALIRLGQRLNIYAFTPGVHDCEIIDMCMLQDNRPLEAYSPAEDEVTALLRVRIEDGLRLWQGDVDHITAQGIQAVHENGITHWQDCIRELSTTDFMPTIDAYYLKVFVLAQRLLAGEQHLVI